MAIILNPLASIRTVARFGEPQGQKGWLTVIPLLEACAQIPEYNYILIRKNSIWRPTAVLGVREHYGHLILRLEGCADLKTAKTYVGCKIALRDALPPELPIEEYQRQEAIAKGHREFGPVGARKEKRYGVSPTEGLDQQAQAHPILNKAVQFGPDDDLNTPVATENNEAQKEYSLQMQLQHEKKLQQQAGLSNAPKPTLGGR